MPDTVMADCLALGCSRNRRAAERELRRQELFKERQQLKMESQRLKEESRLLAIELARIKSLSTGTKYRSADRECAYSLQTAASSNASARCAEHDREALDYIASDAPHPGVSVHYSVPSPQEDNEQTEEAGLEHRTLAVDESSGQHFGA